MTDNAYRPGTWFAAIAPRVAVLVDDHVPHARLTALWQAVQSTDDIDVLLRAVTGGLSADPPAFGLVVVDGMSVRVFVRAGVTALVTNGSGETRSIDSGGVSTRVEYVAGDVARVMLGRAGAPSGVPSLPISSGVVAADSLDWRAPAPEPGSIEADVLALDLLPSTIELPRIHEVPLNPDVLSVHNAPTVAPAADATPAAAGDELLEDTMSDPQVETALGNGSGDHDGFTISRGAIDELRTPSTFVPIIQAISCSQLHVNSPQAQRCRVCGEALQDQEPVSIPRPSMGMLQFSTGQLVELDRRVVVGRSPSAERVSGDDLPQLVQVESPEQDISRSHVEVRLDGWHVLLVDLDSVNGTVVTLPGRSPERLHPREPYPLVPGAVVDLAGEVTFRYEVST